MTAPRFTAQGKQVLRDGEHYADACDGAAADAIVTALNAGWQPIETAPEGNEDTGPFFDVLWADLEHRYLPVPAREINCYRRGNSIARQHGYPAVTTVYGVKPTHWRPAPSPAATREGGE